MRTELSGQEKNIVKVKVEFEAGEFKANLDKAIREISQKVNFPGFRKGHIPRKVLEMRFGKDALYNEAIEKMMPDAITQIVEDYDLHLIDSPSFNPGTIAEGEPLTGELTFEVVPEVRLPELGEIEVERLRTLVTDEMIEQAVLAMRKNLSALNPVSRPAADGDVVTVLVENENGAEPQAEDIDLGEPSLTPKVREAVLGKSHGEALVLDLTPEDAEGQEPEARDAKYLYNVTVSDIKERILPEMAPEFYKKALDIELDSEEAFREEIKKRLHMRLDQENFNAASSAAIKQIVAKVELDVPDTLMLRQIEHLKKMDDASFKQRTGVSIEEFLGKTADGAERYEKQTREQAEEIVRRTLVLDAIGDKFDVTVEKDDIENEINGRAAMFNLDPERMRTVYSNNRDSLAQMADDLRYDKISKAILEHVKVKEVDELSASEKPAAEPSEEKSEEKEERAE